MQDSKEYKFGDSVIKNDLPICVYCGDPSTDRDHLISCSWEGHRSYVNRDKLVKACKWCNSLLGDVPIFSVPGRANYLISRYESKFTKVLSRPFHTEDEILETSNNIQVLLVHSNEEQKWIKEKIINLKSVWSGYEPVPIENIADIVKHGLRFYLPKHTIAAYYPDNKKVVTVYPKVRKLTKLRKFRILELKQSGKPFIDEEGRKWFLLLEGKINQEKQRMAA